VLAAGAVSLCDKDGDAMEGLVDAERVWRALMGAARTALPNMAARM
jgi:hypothetical protein